MFELLTAFSFLQEYWPWLVGGTIVVCVALGYAIMTGRVVVALEGLAVLAVALASSSIYRRGAISERARKLAQEEEAMARTRAVQHEIKQLPQSEIDARLNRWIPK